jgi:hypothetical protein
MTDEKKTRKTNPLRWAVLNPFEGQEALGELHELTTEWAAYVCIGPEFDSAAKANSWLIEHGRPGDTYQLVRITRRGVRIEQKRSLVQGSDD